MRKKRIVPQQKCPSEVYWIIDYGDTFYKISKELNIPMEKLLEANPNIDPYNLQVGSKICVPVYTPIIKK